MSDWLRWVISSLFCSTAFHSLILPIPTALRQLLKIGYLFPPLYRLQTSSAILVHPLNKYWFRLPVTWSTKSNLDVLPSHLRVMPFNLRSRFFRASAPGRIILSPGSNWPGSHQEKEKRTRKVVTIARWCQFYSKSTPLYSRLLIFSIPVEFYELQLGVLRYAALKMNWKTQVRYLGVPTFEIKTAY